jgi:DNA processing protein
VAGIWCLGDLTTLREAPDRAVAIVGTREASAYGERTAHRLAAAAVRAGLVVVSGLARGVDAAAHRGALEAGGRTIAVLGTGVDVPYPVGHRSLHLAIQAQGAVVSEVEPGTRAFRGCFPRRNRIIAALARVTVVVEAGFKSGAINTASQALDQGRLVAAVPGTIDDPRSAGSNLLIRDGALVVADVEDMLTIYGLSTSARTGSAQGSDQLTELDLRILHLLGPRVTASSDLAFQLGMPVGQISGSLLRLELEGFAGKDGGGYFRIPA